MRVALGEAEQANRAHDERYAQLKEQYQRLWQATHDPTYPGYGGPLKYELGVPPQRKGDKAHHKALKPSPTGHANGNGLSSSGNSSAVYETPAEAVSRTDPRTDVLDGSPTALSRRLEAGDVTLGDLTLGRDAGGAAGGKGAADGGEGGGLRGYGEDEVTLTTAMLTATQQRPGHALGSISKPSKAGKPARR